MISCVAWRVDGRQCRAFHLKRLVVDDRREALRLRGVTPSELEYLTVFLKMRRRLSLIHSRHITTTDVVYALLQSESANPDSRPSVIIRVDKQL